MLTIQNFTPPAPSSLHVQIEDARFSAQQTLSGLTHVSRAACKRRVSIRWAHMSAAQLQTLLETVTAQPLITLSFPDPLTGEALTINCYSLDRRIGLKRMKDNLPVWTDIEMTFVES